MRLKSEVNIKLRSGNYVDGANFAVNWIALYVGEFSQWFARKGDKHALDQ